jgi:hypothetical protein
VNVVLENTDMVQAATRLPVAQAMEQSGKRTKGLRAYLDRHWSLVWAIVQVIPAGVLHEAVSSCTSRPCLPLLSVDLVRLPRLWSLRRRQNCWDYVSVSRARRLRHEFRLQVSQ